MIERTHLSILRALDQEGSLTRAADKLCLTQSALSHAIKKLEYHAGTAIWQKEGRAIRLTQAGEYLLLVANRLLPQLEQAERVLARYSSGEKGALRIGIECYPCYRWLLKTVKPYLQSWSGIDIDVKQKFQFGGMAALYSYDIDLLVTPDPLVKEGVLFDPVFDYEQVLVVTSDHRLAKQSCVEPEDLSQETLYSYPVDVERLDIFAQFLMPAHVSPKKHKTMEDTEIMLQMVAAGRGVAALPRWLVEEYASSLPLTILTLGQQGLHKQIFLGVRESDRTIEYVDAFIQLARQST